MTMIMKMHFPGKTFFLTSYHERSSIVQLREDLSVNLKKDSPISKNSDRNVIKICDIDIIDFHGMKLNVKSKLNLPHKRMHKRNFVLLPLFEIEKNWKHPSKKLDIKTLISLLPVDDITSIKQI